MTKLSHLDDRGNASMVDVSAKSVTERSATAEARICISEEAYRQVVDGTLPKGDVVATARIAGIMAAKKTSELIPLCHPLAVTHAGIEIAALPDGRRLQITATAKTTGQTGVEMEALTGAAVAALTVYDMVKAVDKSAVIESVRLLSKSPTEWAQLASVPLNELYGFLSGHSRKLSAEAIEKLAKAAKSTPEEMLYGKRTR